MYRSLAESKHDILQQIIKKAYPEASQSIQNHLSKALMYSSSTTNFDTGPVQITLPNGTAVQTVNASGGFYNIIVGSLNIGTGRAFTLKMIEPFSGSAPNGIFVGLTTVKGDNSSISYATPAAFQADFPVHIYFNSAFPPGTQSSCVVNSVILGAPTYDPVLNDSYAFAEDTDIGNIVIEDPVINPCTMTPLPVSDERYIIIGAFASIIGAVTYELNDII